MMSVIRYLKRNRDDKTLLVGESELNYKFNFSNMTNNDTLTGTWIAVAGIVVSVFAHFNIVVTQDSVVAVIAGVIAVYGVIHQLVVSKKATGSLK